jgi:signal transduction histidine kinase
MPKRLQNAHLMTLLVVGLLGAFFLASDRSLGPYPVILGTWFAACLAAEALWHRALDRVTVLTMAPAAHLAAVAVLPVTWSLSLVGLSAFAGALVWRRERLRPALLWALGAVVPAFAALEALMLAGSHVPVTSRPVGEAFVLLQPRQIFWLIVAGGAYLVVAQGIRALVAGRARGVGPLRAWLRAYGTETELVTSGAMITVGVLAVFCYEILGYRGLLLCVMPILFVRDGSRRYLELEAAQAKLIQNERLAAKGEMAAEIGHELNNYLAAVSGRAQLLIRNLGENGGGVLYTEGERIRQLSTQMAELARGLMDFSHREVKRSAFGLNELVEKTVDFVRPQTRFRGMNFDFSLDPDLPPVEMDPGQIQQVLLTLFGRVADRPVDRTAERSLEIRTFADDRRKTVAIEICTARSLDPGGVEEGGDGSAEAALGVVHRILDRHQGRFESTPPQDPRETYRVLLPAA